MTAALHVPAHCIPNNVKIEEKVNSRKRHLQDAVNRGLNTLTHRVMDDNNAPRLPHCNLAWQEQGNRVNWVQHGALIVWIDIFLFEKASRVERDPS